MHRVVAGFAICILCGSAAALGYVAASHGQGTPTSKQLFFSELQGVQGQVAIMNVVDFPPGTAVPWHMHPEGHELLYVLEGELTFEDQHQKRVSLKTGDVNHVLPNVGHSARNESGTAAKVLVVRIKERTQPVMVSLPR